MNRLAWIKLIGLIILWVGSIIYMVWADFQYSYRVEITQPNGSTIVVDADWATTHDGFLHYRKDGINYYTNLKFTVKKVWNP